MNIKQIFLNLTKHTVPYGKELDYLSDVLPMNILKKDPVGNLYIKIGEDNTTMFTAHLDTVGGDVEVTHVIDKDEIKTDGKSILGADDKAGVVILLYMIESGVPGLYQFFMGEESGCKGSTALSNWVEKNKDNEIYKNINKVISFDRKGKDSVITHQMSDRCCSDSFAESLISEFKKNGLTYRKDTGGVLTDSVQFTDLYAECTNLSVGYFNQHRNIERQDIKFLEELCVACTKIDWKNLKVEREPGSTERLSYGYGNNYHSGGSRYTGSYYQDWEDEEYYTGTGNYSNSWKNARSSNYSSSRTTGEYVTDWKGDRVLTKDTVWCEFDNVHCLKSEAIWVDILGFYTTPDESVKRKNTVVEDTDYKNVNGKIVKSGKDISQNDLIIHPKFGKGRVKKISPDDKKVVIDFEKGGQKQLLLSVAKIKKY